MSFTAQVKDELSRVEGTSAASRMAQLSAIVRICGTLTFHGAGRLSVKVATETGAVARTMIKLTHELFDLQTPLTVRRSNLHNTRNYLIEIPEQKELADDLYQLGILDDNGGLVAGVPQDLLKDEEASRSFLRGAFMAGGFIADPRGDFHLEIVASSEAYADGIMNEMGRLGVRAGLNHRRGAFVIYVKSFDGIVTLLVGMGGERSAQAVRNVRRVKSYKNDVNRRVNAELANQARSTGAAVDQLLLIAKAERLVGIRSLPPAVREFCQLRRANPDVSLAALGRKANPPASKSAMYHRLLRLEHLVQEASSAR